MTTTATSIDSTRSVNDTVLAFPSTLSVFAAHGMDTCCRGAMSVQDAAAQAAVNLDELLTALQAAAIRRDP